MGPDYTTLPAGDVATPYRRYTRAFDTGAAYRTGKLVIKGIPLSAFKCDAPPAGTFDGNEFTGHSGGVVIQVMVPGLTGWLDVGRMKGDPLLGVADFYGCATGYETAPQVTVSFDTTEFTANNGGGKFLLFVRITYRNTVAGLAQRVSEIEWLPPV